LSNIESAQLEFPESLVLERSHVQTTCVWLDLICRAGLTQAAAFPYYSGAR